MFCSRWLISAGAAAYWLAAAAVVAHAQPVPAQLQFSTYFGTNQALNNVLKIVRPGGTDVSFSDIGWDAKPLKPPPIWGQRAIYWTEAMPNFGFGLDFTHANRPSLNRSPFLSHCGSRRHGRRDHHPAPRC